MKTITVRLEGKPTPGDLVILQYSSPRGGRTHVMHRAIGERKDPIVKEDGTPDFRVYPADSAETVAKALSDEITKHWMQEVFSTKAKDNRVIIYCQDAVSDVIFSAEVEGSNSLRVSLEEL